MFRPTAKLFIALAILCLGSVAVVSAQSSYPWEIRLNATEGTSAASVTIGARAGATDGFDSLYDAAAPPAPPPPSCQIVSHISNPSPYYQSLSRDMRSDTQDSVVFELYRDAFDDPVTVTWTLPEGFAPTEMKYGFHYGSASPTEYVSMLEAPYSLTMEAGIRVRIIYRKPPGVDVDPPSVGSLDPGLGNRGPCSTMVSCNVTDFSGVDPSSVTMTIGGTPIPLVDLTLTPITGGYHVVSPMQHFVEAQDVEVCISAADMSGLHNTMTMPFCWNFIARCDTIVDLIPPTVQNPSPVDGATNQSYPNGTVSVWIVDNGVGVDLSSIVFTFAGATIPNSSLMFTPTTGGYLINYTYGGLEAGSTYEWCVTGCDLVPNCMATPACFSFETRPAEEPCVTFSKSVRVYDQNGAGAHNVLTFATDILGSDGFDTGLDLNVPVVFPGTFQSYFPQGTDTLSAQYHLTTDVRSCRMPNMTWKVKATSVTGTYSVQWSAVDFFDPGLPVGSAFKIGVSSSEFTPPADEAVFNMRDSSRIMDIPATSVVWISFLRSATCTPPIVRYQSPAPGDVDVCLTDTVRFEVVDLEEQVDRASIQVSLSDVDITADCLIESTAGGYGYRVTYLGASGHPMYPSATIPVHVIARNLCVPQQEMDFTYSFQTGAVVCASEWTGNIEVKGLRAGDTSMVQLYFGTATGATDGYDDTFDGIAPPPPPSGLDRVFKIDASRPEFERLLRDIRSISADTLVWTITHGTEEDGVFDPLWVEWDPAVISGIGNCILSIWQGGSPTPGMPPVMDNMHTSTNFAFDPDNFVFIQYIRLGPQPPRGLSGVISVEDHADFSGTAVHIENSGGTLQYDGVTASDGRYNFPILPADCYHLTATRDSFVTWDTTICIVDADVVANHQMRWVRYAFCGTVTLTDGTHGGALVTVDGSLSGTTTALDSFSIMVPFNGLSHAVVVSKPRFSVAYDTVIVGAGAACDHNYTLNRVCFGLTGTVMSDGAPVSGVLVTVNNGLTALTNASGIYSLDSCLVDGDYTVVASLTCYDPETTAVTISGGVGTADFTLNHSILELTGTITLEGVTDYSGTQVVVNGTTVSTDTRGAFTIPGLTCGEVYHITATHENYSELADSFTMAVGYTFTGRLNACRNVTTLNVTDSVEHVVLGWASPGAGVTGYDIYRDGEMIGSAAGTATSFTDSDVEFGTTYVYNIVTHYLTCESAQLSSGRSVMVVPSTPTARILVLDFDNGLTNGGTGVSDQVVTWLNELATAANVMTLTQNENLDRYPQAWLNHFDLVYIITARNGAATEYFNAATATMLNTFAGVSGKKLMWEGATVASDVSSLPAEIGTLFARFNVTRVSGGQPQATGNAENVRLQDAWYHTAAVFNYAYRTALDDRNDVIGATGSGQVVAWSRTTADTVGRGRVVKTNNTMFSTLYNLGVTQPTAMYHNGRRLITSYLCSWLSLGCTIDVAQLGPQASVNQPTLEQNSPNPFSGMTTIRFALPNAGMTKLDVYTVTGEHVASLVDENLAAGTYTATWSSEDLTNGVYLYRLTTDNGSAVKSMTVRK